MDVKPFTTTITAEYGVEETKIDFYVIAGVSRKGNREFRITPCESEIQEICVAMASEGFSLIRVCKQLCEVKQKCL